MTHANLHENSKNCPNSKLSLFFNNVYHISKICIANKVTELLQ